jgi:hypothetical protein
VIGGNAVAGTRNDQAHFFEAGVPFFIVLSAASFKGWQLCIFHFARPLLYY